MRCDRYEVNQNLQVKETGTALEDVVLSEFGVGVKAVASPVFDHGHADAVGIGDHAAGRSVDIAELGFGVGFLRGGSGKGRASKGGEGEDDLGEVHVSGGIERECDFAEAMGNRIPGRHNGGKHDRREASTGCFLLKVALLRIVTCFVRLSYVTPRQKRDTCTWLTQLQSRRFQIGRKADDYQLGYVQVIVINE
ncbi:hypothetical protein K458DRAFT_459990 [Lentithecium fluviatile CBS 122367]|uniref:Uncharacterized protein n=1 Tax=Lentithecium fluviatile CBS 122367 TaxID=1168545 RepID=A0A6G1IPQ3_9PLEO|nr:hypothetical protein K458DRAFT_459990 [Lentithecium fluviatile CBS 122367]